MTTGCGAPSQAAPLPASVDTSKASVIVGTASKNGSPVGGAYVRLLDEHDEFTAEVVTSPGGDFRFFAAPGDWTLSVLHRDGSARHGINVSGPGIHEAQVALA